MFNYQLFVRLINLPKPFLHIRYRSNEVNIEKLEADSSLDSAAIDEELALKEEFIQMKRNKSRLNPQHQNIVHNKPPYKEATHWSHQTLKYNRKLYGKYGNESNFNPSLCWPTKEELQMKQDYESVAYPYTIQQLMEMSQKTKQDREIRVQLRQEDIMKKMLKLENWKIELKNKMQKKEADAYAAKSRKEKLIDEVRRHFGYTVDPRDDKFKELLEKKEKEQKKAMKEARKKEKELKMVVKLTSKNELPKEEPNA